MPETKAQKAKRFKRNYRLVNNAYHNPTLSKTASTWPDDRLYSELGIKVTKTMPKLNARPKSKQAYYNRKFDKFIYARQQGLNVKEAKAQRGYKQTKIKLNARYLVADRLRIKNNKSDRIDMSRYERRRALWSDMMKDKKSMPPEIVRRAKEINANTRIGGRMDKTGKMVGGKQLDPYDKYGYVVQHYMFVENKTMEEIELLVKQDNADALSVIYTIEVSAV